MSEARPDYASLKTQTKRGQRRVEDLIALTSQNDPFYITPGREQQGHWFDGLYHRFDVQPNAHVRGIHYKVVSQREEDLPSLPDGKPYLNTEKCWAALLAACANARYLGLIAADAFIDRRAPPPKLHATAPVGAPEPGWDIPATLWSLPSITTRPHSALLDFPEPEVKGYDYYDGDQPYLLEVWIEKSTMNDMLEPICRRLGANLVTGVGFISISAVVKMLQRVATDRRPARIFYISDHDPRGETMPLAVARQAEFWLGHYAPDADIKLTPVALTPEQVERYGLPRTPIKDGHNQKARFVERHDGEAVELDALEALYPGELARLVEDAVAPYVDEELAQRLEDAASEAQSEAEQAWEDATVDERVALERIEREAEAIADRYAARLQALSDELDADLEPLKWELEAVRQAMAGKIPTLGVELPSRPEPDVDPPDEDEYLYASERDYFEQLGHYRERRGQRKARPEPLPERACLGCGETFEPVRKDQETCTRYGKHGKNCWKKAAYQRRKGARGQGAA